MNKCSIWVLAGAMLAVGSARVEAQELPDDVVSDIQDAVAAEFEEQLTGEKTGSVGVFNATNWGVSFEGDVRFPDDPSITCDGESCLSAFFALSGFDVEAFAIIEIDIDAHYWVNPPLSTGADGDVEVRKVVGALVVVPVVLTDSGFGVDDDEAKVALTDEGGNVVVDGLDGDFVRIGSLGLGVPFGFTGAGIGALAGFFAADAAENKIKEAIQDEFAKQLGVASEELTLRLQDELAKQKDTIIGSLTAMLVASV